MQDVPEIEESEEATTPPEPLSKKEGDWSTFFRHIRRLAYEAAVICIFLFLGYVVHFVLQVTHQENQAWAMYLVNASHKITTYSLIFISAVEALSACIEALAAFVARMIGLYSHLKDQLKR